MRQRLARRHFMRGAVLASIGALIRPKRPRGLARAAQPHLPVASRPAGTRPGSEWRIRPDLCEPAGSDEAEVIQVTSDPESPCAHIYMEAQIFTPDSQRYILHRPAHAHGSSPRDPRHQFLRCDLDDNLSLHPLTHEQGATAPAVSPDGQYLYYVVNEARRPGRGRLTLKRVNLDGADRQTILVMDGPLAGTNYRPSRPYGLSTISSDGARLAISAFLGDGLTAGAPHGLIVIDLIRATAQLVMHGPTWGNMHPQFSRSLDPEQRRDILVQENHGTEPNARGLMVRHRGTAGADIHVIRDDGTYLRDLPWGRDAEEFCQGHQCWRGRTNWAITSTIMSQTPDARLIESGPLPHIGHVGRKRPDGMRNELSREVPDPRFYHFATDIAGTRLISDFGAYGPEQRVCAARLGAPGEAPLSALRTIARPKSSGTKDAHLHPFLSPDGRTGFFNSDESGVLQAYMIRGFAEL